MLDCKVLFQLLNWAFVFELIRVKNEVFFWLLGQVLVRSLNPWSIFDDGKKYFLFTIASIGGKFLLQVYGNLG